MGVRKRNGVKAVSLLRSPDKIEVLKAAFEELAVPIEFRLDRLAEAAPHLINGHAPDVLLVEFAAPDAQEIEILRSLSQQNGKRTKILATTDQISVEHVRALMRAGATDFISQPLHRADIVNAVRAALHDDEDSSLAGEGAIPVARTIAVLRASGGAGGTTVGLETAAALAQQTDGSVCYLDLDLQFGNAALLLDLASDKCAMSLLEHSDAIDPSFLRKLCVRHKSGLSVLPAPNEIVPLEALTPRIVRAILGAARSIFTTVFVDLPLAWSDWSLAVLKETDLGLLVTGISVPELDRANRFLRGLAEHGCGELDVLVVANRVPRFWAGDRLEQAARVLDRRIAHAIVRDDDTVHTAQDRGVRLMDAGGRRLQKDFRALAAEIAQRACAAGGQKTDAVRMY